jgi:hypothetical protein
MNRVHQRRATRQGTPSPDSGERGASVKPDVEILERFNTLVSADAAQAIEHLGHKRRMKTTRWAFACGLSRWEAVREVDGFIAGRRTLNAAGSVEVYAFNHWTPGLPDPKRYTMYGVSKPDAGRCTDLAAALGTGTERMAGLCVEAGMVDAPGIPLATNHRMARTLRHVMADMRERLLKMERLCDGDPAEPRRIVTWAEVIGERAGTKAGRRRP